MLPEGWRGRLVKVQDANTAAPSGEPRFTGWCLDEEDLCVAKLIAFRERDRNFVDALPEAGLVDRAVVSTRLATVAERFREAARRAETWLQAATD